MQEKYREAVNQASQILAKALIDDIENIVEQGKLLDKHVQVLVRETGRLTVSRMYAAADHYLTETYKAEGWRIEQHPVVEFRTLFGPVERASAYLWKPGEGDGVRPMKEVMGVVGNGYSEAVERALVDFGSEKSGTGGQAVSGALWLGSWAWSDFEPHRSGRATRGTLC